jgi:hypothetical protein
MVKIWLVKSNVPEDWDFTGLEIAQGKRTFGDLTNRLAKSKFIQSININDTDDGSDFLNKLSTSLECTSETFVNTIQVYPHSNYKIECTYRSDLNFQNSQDFNYFSTVINTESVNIFGSVIFFKTNGQKLMNLELEELVGQIANFYFLRTYKLKTDGKFEEIGMSNFEPDIDRMLRGYKVKKIGDWLIFSDDSKSNLSELKESGNNINEFKNLIWLKVKTYIGDIHKALESTAYEKNKDGDLRGIYMDLDPEYIISVFF